MWSTYIQASNIDDVIHHLADYGSRARVIAGGTDLMLEMERGSRRGIEVLIDVTRIHGLSEITLDDQGWIHVGPTATHNHCVASELIRRRAYPLARACWEVGSPQIRNRGTVAGNIITASPANDTITPLMALGAVITLRSLSGDRRIPLAEFYTGVRRNVMRDDEFMVDIAFPALREDQVGTFVKFALRKAQAISLVNLSVILSMTGGVVGEAIITLGAVAPTIIHAEAAEKSLVGKALTEESITAAAVLTMEATRPINDLRGSAKYRRTMARVIAQRALRSLRDGSEQEDFPEMPVKLWGGDSTGKTPVPEGDIWHENGQQIETTINGKAYALKGCHSKTLLRMLREDAGLIGTKEGCAEGECGACTVILDGKAVMSCMVPAARAHGAVIQTVEGLAGAGELHPVQKAFVDEGAVQCGYCTPGFLISAAVLLEEYPKPTKNQIEQAMTGNLCRCTGYYKIVLAVEKAARTGGK